MRWRGSRWLVAGLVAVLGGLVAGPSWGQAGAAEPTLGDLLDRTRQDLTDQTAALTRGGLTLEQWHEVDQRLAQLAASVATQQEALRTQLASVQAEQKPLSEQLDALRQSEVALVEAAARLPAEGATAAQQAEQARLARRQREVAAEREALDAERAPLRAREEQLATWTDTARRLAGEVSEAQALAGQRQEMARQAGQLDKLTTDTAADGLTAEALAEALNEALGVQQAVESQLTAWRAELATTDEKLAELGPEAPTDDPELTRERAAQGATSRRLKQGIDDAVLNLQRAEKLVAELQARSQAATAAQLLRREPTVLAEAVRLVTEPQDWAGFGRRIVLHGTGLAEVGPAGRWGAVLLLVLAVPVGRRLRRWLAAAATACTPDRFAPTLLRALYASIALHAVPLTVVGAAAAWMSQLSARTDGRPPLSGAVYALLLFYVLRTVLRTFLAPYPPAAAFTGVGRDREYEIARRASILVLVGVFGLLLFTAAGALEMPAAPYQLARSAFVLLWSINLSWLFVLLGRLPRLARYGRLLRVVVFGLLVVAVGADLLGYHYLALWLLAGVAGTALLSPCLWLAGRLATEIFDGLNDGSGAWARVPRRWLGLAEGEGWPGIGWLRFLASAVVWLVGLAVLVRLWTSPSGFETARRLAQRGVPVGSVTLVPDQAVAGLLVFGALMVLAHSGRRALDDILSRRSRLDQGARAATVTLAGYVGFVLSALVGVTVGGLDLRQLAVVVGALSVGIGFGLQNIVNNFVSGLILLFERPIRVGDWIRVGDVEGQVQKMSVRSTEIQGVNRQETIVPNSDLISRSVVNLTRHDSIGRGALAVAVAGDADPRQVEALLLEIARGHEALLSGSEGYPRVLLLGCTQARLDFELRVALRDVRASQQVISDLHFQIHERFAAAGLRFA